MKFDTILVLDFGGQYCHLIGRRVREHNVYSEMVPYDITATQIKALKGKFNLKGIILSGGPSSIYEENAPKCDPDINWLLVGEVVLIILIIIAYVKKIQKE